jgi:hypothetical protein
MTVANDGAIYTAVETDKSVWQQFPNQQGGRGFGGLNGCPTAISAGAQYVWVLSQCSGPTHVIRLDPRQGLQTSSQTLTGGGLDILAHRGQVWVAHFNKTHALSVIDENTLAVRIPAIQGSFALLTGSGNTVYAAGTADSGHEVVMAIHPSTLQELRRHVVDQRIALIADDDRHVVALGEQGKIWVFSANNLELQRIINLRVGTLDSRAMLLLGDDIYLTNNQQQGSDSGAVLVVSGWRPASVPARSAAPAQGMPGGSQGMPGSAQGMPGGSQGMPGTAQGMPGGSQGMPGTAQGMPSATQVMPGAATATMPSPLPDASATACPYQIVNVASSSVAWLYEDPDASARKIVAVPSDARGLVADRCLRDWCHVTFRGANGWVQRTNIQPTCN